MIISPASMHETQVHFPALSTENQSRRRQQMEKTSFERRQQARQQPQQQQPQQNFYRQIGDVGAQTLPQMGAAWQALANAQAQKQMGDL